MSQRVSKCRQDIKDAFVQLLRSKDPDRISVKELCARAGVNRSTFYQHYEYMEALIGDVISDCVYEVCMGGDLLYEFVNENTVITRKSIRSYMDRFQKNRTLIRFCMLERNESYLGMIIRTQVEISMNRSDAPVRYYPAFFQNAGVLSVLIEWIRNGKPVPEEMIVEIIYRFSGAMYEKEPYAFDHGSARR